MFTSIAKSSVGQSDRFFPCEENEGEIVYQIFHLLCFDKKENIRETPVLSASCRRVVVCQPCIHACCFLRVPPCIHKII